MSEESKLQNAVMNVVNGRTDARLFRNNVGMCNKRNIGLKYGLAGKGSSDLIGWKSVIITPDMIGEKLAIFTAIEVKSQKGRLSPAQLNFINQVNLSGGIAVVVRDINDLPKIFGEEETNE